MKRVGIDWPGEANRSGRIERHPVRSLRRTAEMRPDHHIGRLPTFYPRLQIAQIVERRYALAASAMIHAGDREEPVKILRGLGAAHRLFHGFVVVESRAGHLRHIRVALVAEQLSAGVSKSAQIRISIRVEHTDPAALGVVVEIEVGIVPLLSCSGDEARVFEEFVAPGLEERIFPFKLGAGKDTSRRNSVAFRIMGPAVDILDGLPWRALRQSGCLLALHWSSDGSNLQWYGALTMPSLTPSSI